MANISYAYTKVKPFSWNRFLKLQNKTHKQIQEAILAASKWVTCASGTMCSVLPRQADGAPKDLALYRLGKKFYEAVQYCHWNDCKAILIEIEERSDILIGIERARRKKVQEDYDRAFAVRKALAKQNNESFRY